MVKIYIGIVFGVLIELDNQCFDYWVVNIVFDNFINIVEFKCILFEVGFWLFVQYMIFMEFDFMIIGWEKYYVLMRIVLEEVKVLVKFGDYVGNL